MHLMKALGLVVTLTRSGFWRPACSQGRPPTSTHQSPTAPSWISTGIQWDDLCEIFASPSLSRPLPLFCQDPQASRFASKSQPWSGNLWVVVIVKSLVNWLTWLLIDYSLLCNQSEASLLVEPTLDNDYNQGRAEDFQIGVALRISACAAREKFLSAKPKFLSTTGIFSF